MLAIDIDVMEFCVKEISSFLRVSSWSLHPFTLAGWSTSVAL